MTIIAVTITGFTPDEPRKIYSGNWTREQPLADLESAIEILQHFVNEKKSTPVEIATSNSIPIPVL